jgi:hypothetical protein
LKSLHDLALLRGIDLDGNLIQDLDGVFKSLG